ncbi:hypothetical protein VTN77DRAFT_9876 [Rasamsonia byssochlamydoides]|uniref:uncharacterized protein n=1 Tax=Rasamsonia byssochlamydoides TaxID=89139 RepID=UPI00374263AB
MRDQFHRSPVSRPAVPVQMNPDKQNNGAPAKPFTPSLSAAFRTTTKNSYPLTPRLAGAGGYQTPKKIPHSDTASPLPHRDDSVPAYLSANVTPRSGSRNSRRDGALSSPENTPRSAQQASQTSRPTLPLVAGGHHRTERSPVRGSGKQEPPRLTRAKSVTGDGLNRRATSRPNSSYESSGGSPMFFHADDARSSVSSYDTETRPRSYVKSSQAPTFLYADGTRDQEPQEINSNLSRTPSTNTRRSNGSARPPVAATNQPDILPRLRSSQLSDPESRRSADSSLQPSPNIEDTTESKSQRSSPAPNLAEQVARPSSLVGQNPAHRKSCSLDSTPQVTSPRGGGRRASPIISSAFLPPEVLNGPRVVNNISSDSAESHGPSFPLVQSPIKMEGQTPYADEHAINARTERKVLDLEISNSSLLAINRTLERELRKQNAELRRYRRLSRSGRLSMTTSLRSASGGGLSVVSETDDGVSEPSSMHSPDNELSDSSDNDSSFADDGTLTPNTATDQETRIRTNDEKRFLLDLAKHQELIKDSQKINQSIKRCLGWTEELIREGKKALEYHVRVSDVELGGRVLAPDELGDEVPAARALLGPAAELEDDLSIGSSDEESSEEDPDQ